MDYDLIRQIIDLLKDFEQSCKDGRKYPISKEGFIAWVSENYTQKQLNEDKSNQSSK